MPLRLVAERTSALNSSHQVQKVRGEQSSIGLSCVALLTRNGSWVHLYILSTTVHSTIIYSSLAAKGGVITRWERCICVQLEDRGGCRNPWIRRKVPFAHQRRGHNLSPRVRAWPGWPLEGESRDWTSLAKRLQGVNNFANQRLLICA